MAVQSSYYIKKWERKSGGGFMANAYFKKEDGRGQNKGRKERKEGRTQKGEKEEVKQSMSPLNFS